MSSIVYKTKEWKIVEKKGEYFVLKATDRSFNPLIECRFGPSTKEACRNFILQKRAWFKKRNSYY